MTKNKHGFVSGDKVRATETHQGNGITKGKIYTVHSAYSDMVNLTVDDSGRRAVGVFSSRFELVTGASQFQFQPGDRVRCTQGVPGLSRYGAFGDLGKVVTVPNSLSMMVEFDKDGRTTGVAQSRFEKVVENPKAPEPKFKAGDTVRALETSKLNSITKGKLYVVRSVEGNLLNLVEDDDGHKGGGAFAKRFEKVEEAPKPALKADFGDQLGGAFTGPYRVADVIQKKWIIAVLDSNGLPRPSTKPATYATEAQAHAVAKSMAEKHPGEAFMVFQATAVAAIPKAVKVELVKL